MTAPAPTHDPTLAINGVGLYVEERGSGAPVVCIHGAGGTTLAWTSAIDKLSRLGRVIAYDRRGCARSERPEHYERTSIAEHADDAAALIDALGAAPAVVIGRSQGGEIAVDLALRYPDRVRALALLEGGGLALGMAFREWLAAVDEEVFAAAEVDVSTVGEVLLRRILGDAAWEELPEEVQQVFAENGPAIVAEERGGLLDVSAEQLGAIVQPTLLVAGKDSPRAFAEVTEVTAAAIPSARIAWVEGGHLIDAAHPAVLGFVDEVLGRD